MQSTRKRRTSQIHSDDYAIDHPFIRWYARYWKPGAASYTERSGAEQGTVSGDVFMGEMASSRFSIGADDDRVPALGISHDDAEAVMSMPWSGAAFLRRVNRRDWIALSCLDARMQGSATPSKVPLRLWLPATIGLLDAWVGMTPVPTSLRVVAIRIIAGKPEPVPGPPLGLLPLSFKGSWEKDPESPASPITQSTQLTIMDS